ncbi:MAG: hypothetical protein E3J86_12920 [Candidatus Thorarchaeota archaeon]|nr:MAG: hypothetical protein E3J86_12920 [Candidatus Thorarchaeota archaeon]
MNRSILAALSAVVIVAIVFVIIWVLGLTSLSSYMGAIGGMVGGVLGATYLQRFQDERFSQLMNLAARNVFVYLMILLPLSIVFLFQIGEITLQIATGLIFVPWMSSLVIYFLSLLYYYRK